jgi:hypothetical protein
VDPARLAPAQLSAPVRARAQPNDKDREALGRSRGGLTSKIHLLADCGCRPLARVTSAGQRHDSLPLVPLMGQLRIARLGPGRPRCFIGSFATLWSWMSRVQIPSLTSSETAGQKP